MADLRNLSSVFEIGFAIHLAFPLFEQLRQRAINRQVSRIKQLDEVAGARMEEWMTFKGRVEFVFSSLSSLTVFCSWSSFVVSLSSLATLLWVGFSPGDRLEVPSSQAAILVALSLLPLPIMVLAIERKARYLESYLEEHHRFFAWITAMYGPRNSKTEPNQVGQSA